MRARIRLLNRIAAALLVAFAVLLPFVAVRRVNRANASPDGRPVGPDQAGADWDPHGYLVIVLVMFAAPVLFAGIPALARTFSGQKAGSRLLVVTAVFAGGYLLLAARHLPVWLVVMAVVLTAGTAAVAIAGLATARAPASEPGSR